MPALSDDLASLRLDEMVSLLRRAIETIKSPQNAGAELEKTNLEASFCNPLTVASSPIPCVRECTWRQFKNRDVGEPLCVVEKLVSSTDLSLQVLDECRRRGKMAPIEKADDELAGSMTRHREEPWIHRVRILSTAVLQLLNIVSGDNWDVTRAHSFMRPFGYLIYHQDRLKEGLAILDSQLSGKGVSQDTGSVGETPVIDAAISAASVVQQIRCFVDFVDRDLMPLYTRFQSNEDSSTTILFDDLWYLFRPGDLIYIPFEAGGNHRTLAGISAHVSSVEQRVWRVAAVHPHQTHVRGTALFSEEKARTPDGSDSLDDSGDETDSSRASSRRSKRHRPGGCVIFCYYLDLDGNCLAPMWRKLVIPPFLGEKRIRDLPAYPIRFFEEASTLLGELKEQGGHFLQCLRLRHLSFNGWALLKQPDGGDVLNIKGQPHKNSIHYQGEVYIDVKEAMNENRFWALRSPRCRPYRAKASPIIELYRVVDWADKTQTKALAAHYETIVRNDDIQRFEFNRYLETNQFMSMSGGGSAQPPVEGDDLALLSRRIYVYLLRYRIFIPADVRDLKPITPQPNALDWISMDAKDKRTLKAVVDTHFKQMGRVEYKEDTTAEDLVREKGRGLVILLQGPPGTGKTATVEAIAQANDKPLLSVDVADIYDDEFLNRIFRRAEMWNCIVVIDEVDVYLTQRNKHDMTANQNVSILLRILETFTGILFLTTCRPGALDEGVKSRVHLNICYRPLSLEQTEEIFKFNLERLDRIEGERSVASGQQRLVILDDEILEFARDHYLRNSEKTGRWNGRQIRNAFRIAAAIAHYRYVGKPKAQPQLQASDFEVVEQLIRQYDVARAMALGNKPDSYLALEREDRWDGDEDEERLVARSRRRMGPSHRTPSVGEGEFRSPDHRSRLAITNQSRPPQDLENWSNSADPISSSILPTASPEKDEGSWRYEKN